MAKMQKDETQVFLAPILYRAWGYRFKVIQNYEAAMKAFLEAMKYSDGDDVKTLIGLSQTETDMTRYETAAKWVDKCMAIDPQNYGVKWRRVETLFLIAEFGFSLIHAHQGMRRHRFPFEWGVFQGNETIEDCVGRNTSPVALRNLSRWIQQVQEQRKILIAKLEEEEDEFEGIDFELTKFKVNDPEAKLQAFLKRFDRVMAQIYLGHLAHDKHFIESVKESSNIWSANAEGSRNLHNLAHMSYKRSCYRQEILKARSPVYVIRFRRKLWPETHKMHIRRERDLRKSNIIIEADFLLTRLHIARMKRDYVLFFRYVDRTKFKFDSYSDEMFPLKQKCLDAVYRMAAWAYIDTRNVLCLDDEETKDLYLKHHLGIRVAKLPRDSELAWVNTPSKSKALKCFRERLALASDPVELAWLNHDLAKLLEESHRYDLARFYAKKARDIGFEIKNEQWALNGNHILIRIELHQHNKNEAMEASQLALVSAKKLGIDYLIDFYRRAIKFINESISDKVSGIDGISAREQLILELMPQEYHASVDFLFRSMNVVPASRRLSVMPGCKPVNKKFKMSCKKNTILLNASRDPEKEAREALLKQYAPSKEILGWVNFEEYE